MYDERNPAPFVFAVLVFGGISASLIITQLLAISKKAGTEVSIWRSVKLTSATLSLTGAAFYGLLFLGHVGYVTLWDLGLTGPAFDNSVACALLLSYLGLSIFVFGYSGLWLALWAREGFELAERIPRSPDAAPKEATDDPTRKLRLPPNLRK